MDVATVTEGTVPPEVRMTVADISIANTCITIETIVRKMGWWPWEGGSAMSVVKRGEREERGRREGGEREERGRREEGGREGGR